MSNFFNFLGYRPFLSEIDIRRMVIEFMNANPLYKETAQKPLFFNMFDPHFDLQHPIQLMDLKVLLIFKTNLQQTWLVATPERIYCILDDIEKDSTNTIIKWIEPKSNVNRINIRDKSSMTGILDFGKNHSGWLYSKNLFVITDIYISLFGLFDGICDIQREY